MAHVAVDIRFNSMQVLCRGICDYLKAAAESHASKGRAIGGMHRRLKALRLHPLGSCKGAPPSVPLRICISSTCTRTAARSVSPFFQPCIGSSD